MRIDFIRPSLDQLDGLVERLLNSLLANGLPHERISVNYRSDHSTLIMVDGEVRYAVYLTTPGSCAII